MQLLKLCRTLLASQKSFIPINYARGLALLRAKLCPMVPGFASRYTALVLFTAGILVTSVAEAEKKGFVIYQLQVYCEDSQNATAIFSHKDKNGFMGTHVMCAGKCSSICSNCSGSIADALAEVPTDVSAALKAKVEEHEKNAATRKRRSLASCEDRCMDDCPAHGEINRLIAEAETRLNGIEQLHQAAAATRSQCMGPAQIKREVCVKVRKPEYNECLKNRPASACEMEQDLKCPLAQVACGAELRKENQLNWQRMFLTQNIAELKKLDFKCPGPDGQCVQLYHKLAHSQSKDFHEKLCPQGLRAEFRFIFNVANGEPIGSVFVQCL